MGWYRSHHGRLLQIRFSLTGDTCMRKPNNSQNSDHHTQLTWTPAYPFPERNRSHSAATSLKGHSKRCTIPLLSSHQFGSFCAEPHETNNTRRRRTGSFIFAIVIVEWNDQTFYIWVDLQIGLRLHRPL